MRVPSGTLLTRTLKQTGRSGSQGFKRYWPQLLERLRLWGARMRERREGVVEPGMGMAVAWGLEKFGDNTKGNG